MNTGTVSPAPSTLPHVRARLPRKRGSQFYRDRNDYSGYAATLCGAPVTDRDIDFFTAGTKKFKASGWRTCEECVKAREAMK